MFMTRVQIVYKMVMIYLIFKFVSLNLFAFVRPFISLQIPFGVNFRRKVDIAGDVSSQKKKLIRNYHRDLEVNPLTLLRALLESWQQLSWK